MIARGNVASSSGVQKLFDTFTALFRNGRRMRDQLLLEEQLLGGRRRCRCPPLRRDAALVRLARPLHVFGAQGGFMPGDVGERGKAEAVDGERAVPERL